MEAEGKTAAGRVKYLLGVASGKGGVGKSTITVLLAQTALIQGLKVGILDADITGPSVPRLLGAQDLKAEMEQGRILPPKTDDGIKLISINMLLEDERTPVIWRGPLLSKAIEQFWNDTDWGELDLLLVDFPPGTSDVMLTALQSVPLTGMIFVVTPMDFVSMIVSKSIQMGAKLGVPVLGFVENMGMGVCPHCQKEFPLFASEEAEQALKRLSIPRLGSIPWTRELVVSERIMGSMLPKPVTLELEGIFRQVLTLVPR
ncbi:MAG: Mrp/NBP35 family ATP-binding protein [Spirochaetes bacterium]|nr:Mrp/NBP35 family ATP-binding protein [Spirochaetota bacterium]